jgi:hypothetical protein
MLSNAISARFNWLAETYIELTTISILPNLIDIAPRVIESFMTSCKLVGRGPYLMSSRQGSSVTVKAAGEPKTAMVETIPRIRCREISGSDIGDVANLLQKGFPSRSLRFWLTNLDLLAGFPTPVGCPKYGYILESDGAPVGVVLTVSSQRFVNNGHQTQCNLSAWYVEPAYRSYAALFAARVWKEKNFTYLNINPAVHTRPTIEAQGFRCYSHGQFIAIPSLSRGGGDTGVTVPSVGAHSCAPSDSWDRDLLLAHEKYGCLSLYCVGPNFVYPFVFRRRLLKGLIPCAQLIYCREIADVVRFASPLGRFLAARGEMLVLIDSNGPISGLVGKYLRNYLPKYFKGPVAPRLGDLAYTEVAIFGV